MALNILLTNTRGLIGINALFEMVLQDLEGLSRVDWIDNRQILKIIEEIIHYDSDGFKEDNLNKLISFKDSLIGTDFDEFLSLSHIQTILPHITLHNTPVACTCSPYMVAGPSKEPVGDRIAVVGDALGARFYRDGLFSAFVSAQALAKTVIHKGVNKKSLSDGYDRVVKWL